VEILELGTRIGETRSAISLGTLLQQDKV